MYDTGWLFSQTLHIENQGVLGALATALGCAPWIPHIIIHICGLNAATNTATAMHRFKCREIEAGRGAGCPMSVADASAKESAG